MIQLSPKRSIVLVLATAVLLVPALFTGCSERCDPGYHLEKHLCYVDAASDSAGAAGAAGAADAPSCDAPSMTTFGAVCHSDADCVCDSDFCAGYPGQAGVCTRSGCDVDPSRCPSGYTCMDLSAFGSGLPAICTAP